MTPAESPRRVHLLTALLLVGTFRMPPQEAQDACATLTLDAPCRFTFDGRAHQGTCRRGPDGQGPVACAPDRGPKPGLDPGPGKAKGEGSPVQQGQPQR